MAELLTHKCIKAGCDNTYQSEEQDPYLCASCIEVKNKVAKEIDSKVVRDKPRIPSEFELYQQITKATGKPFINARDLGLF